MPCDVEIHADLTERPEVWRLERHYLAGAHLGCSIAAQQLVAEEDGDFRNLILARNKQSAQQVVNSVSLQLQDGYLTTGEHNWFIQILEHK